MKAKKLIHEIGRIDEQLITEYDEKYDAVFKEKTGIIKDALDLKVGSEKVHSAESKTTRPPRKTWRKPAVAAALIVLLAVAGFVGADRLGLLQFLTQGGAQSGGAGANAKTYMFYEGPVLPLTFLEPQGDLTVKRSTTYDFLPYTDATETYEVDTVNGVKTITNTSHRTEAKVEDRYLIQNDSKQNRTLQIAYPYAASLSDLFQRTPTMSFNGREIEPEITAGQYSGSFTGPYSMGPDSAQNKGQKRQVNLLLTDSWLGYQKLLADGSYMSNAFAGQTHADQTAIIYEFSDFVIEAGEGQLPSIAVSYKAADSVKVLSYGFHGADYPGGDIYHQGFSIPEPENPHDDSSRFCLIVLGGDISEISYQGYGNMGWNPSTEMKINAKMTRSITTLKAIFQELLINHYNQFYSYFGLENTENKNESTEEPDAGSAWIQATGQLELLFNAAFDYLHSYGTLSAKPMERYQTAWLADMFSEAANVERILYLHTTVTIPAGSTAELSVAFSQRGSHDYGQKKDTAPDAKGYDLTTSLGSNIRFSEQNATIADHGLIEIVEQNFGFDLEQNIRSVVLNPDVDYYYMLVKKVP